MSDLPETIDRDNVEWLRLLGKYGPLVEASADFLAIADELEQRRAAAGASRAAFSNAIRILHSIDLHELLEAGAIASGDGRSWQAFRSNPSRFFVRADDEVAAAIWRIIEQRQGGT